MSYKKKSTAIKHSQKKENLIVESSLQMQRATSEMSLAPNNHGLALEGA